MNVDLTPQLERMVREKIEAGAYSSASEMMQEALRLQDAQDQLQQARHTALQRDIQVGLESGPATEWDAAQIKREGRAYRDGRR